MTANSADPVRVYVSHSGDREDLSLVDEFLRHLMGLEAGGKLKVQTSSTPRASGDIAAGTVRALEGAELVIVALSPHVFASKWMLGVELPRAQELRREGRLVVATLRLREVTGIDVAIPWLAGFVGFPVSGDWVGAKRRRDQIWHKIATEVDDICESILAGRQ